LIEPSFFLKTRLQQNEPESVVSQGRFFLPTRHPPSSGIWIVLLDIKPGGIQNPWNSYKFGGPV